MVLGLPVKLSKAVFLRALFKLSSGKNRAAFVTRTAAMMIPPCRCFEPETRLSSAFLIAGISTDAGMSGGAAPARPPPLPTLGRDSRFFFPLPKETHRGTDRHR